jgi:tripartite-type tricarboxylate transporter receptor subunit TctC
LHFGIVAPAGTPRPIVDKLNAAMREALAMKEVQEKLAKAGMDSSPGTPEEYGAYLERERKKWAGVIKTAGIKTD